VYVTFYGRRVGTLGVASRYYRTTRGFGVGSKIPLGPCHKPRIVPASRREYRWHGFVYNALEPRHSMQLLDKKSA
jgi:hypothetical protein